MSLKNRERVTGILFVLPFLVGFLLFYIVPFGISVGYSFTSGIGGGTFAGLAHYAEVLQSYAFRLAASNTFRFMGIGIPLIMAISLGLSLLLFGNAGHTKVFRSIFLYPMAVPIGSVVMFVQVMFSEFGIYNRILYRLGWEEQEWLQSGLTFYVLLFLYIWKNCGYNIVLFLTGLNAIPAECEEAAKLDGAGRRQYFCYIQWPLLFPSVLFVFVMSVINAFKCYREAYLLGGKYPHKSIYMLQHFMNNNFENLNYQRLSVAAILVFCIIFLLVILLFAVKFRGERDEGKQMRQSVRYKGKRKQAGEKRRRKRREEQEGKKRRRQRREEQVREAQRRQRREEQVREARRRQYRKVQVKERRTGWRK